MLFTAKQRPEPVRSETPVSAPWRPRFGTDGIRGRANQELTAQVAMRLGQAVGSTLARGGRLAVAQDTRRSGDMLIAGLVAGITSVGVDVTTLGVVPTATLAFVASRWRYDGGVMVSASHNPAADNGLKVFDGSGLKLDPVSERRIEALMEGAEHPPLPGNHGLGRVDDGAVEVERYRAHRTGIARSTSTRVRIVVDCANGSASPFAAAILGETGADVTLMGATPTGTNINEGCGATAPMALAARVLAEGADLGLAFDGDADRCVVVDEHGDVVDGDALLGLLAIDRARRGRLQHGLLVTTVVSNGGLDEALARHGGRVIRTAVGDRSVWEGMAATGACLGGEKSGHLIVREHATTGDGIVTALEILDVVARSGRRVSEVASEVPLWPQQERSVSVVDRDAAARDTMLEREIHVARERLGRSGRILVRPSGTEPLVRIMVEGPEFDRVVAIADGLADLIRERHPQR